MADLTRYARQSTVKLTTKGRKSGQPRTVTIWFVVAAPDRIEVQHARQPIAQWYKNLAANPDVTIDFGDGPIAARGRLIEGQTEKADVLRRIRAKHWILGPVIQRGTSVDTAVAAAIQVVDRSA